MLRPSLDIEGEGHSHISYLGGQRLDYAYQGATGWHVEEVQMVGYVGTVASRAVSADGQPHISFYDDNWLRYATSDGHPRFSYAFGLDPYWHKFALRYAYRDASGGHYQSVESR